MCNSYLNPHQSGVLAVDRVLRLNGLRRLIDNEIQILRIPRFIDQATCSVISAGLKRHGHLEYINEPGVSRIGRAFSESGSREDLLELYFSNAFDNIDVLRQACHPHASPIDTLRCVLDERWPAGCHLQTLYGRKMFVGLSRSMKPGTPLLPHHDMFARHAPDTPEAASLVSQFGINVYVDVPPQGGELALWMDEISDAEFLRRRGDKYAMPIECLGKPDVRIKPVNGDLILFNARKLHAVLPGFGCDRLTLSAFFGYRGRHQPLTVWS